MGGGGSTTTVSSAMSDEQFGTLSENQANIATSIDAGRADATEQFGQVDTALTGLGTSIEGVGNNLTTGFTSMQDLMGQNMEANQQAFAGVNENINQSTGAIQTGLQSGFAGVNEGMTAGFGNMDQQFADVGQRFDRVDDAQQTAQTTMDTGFQNQANTMNDLGIQMSDGFAAANQTATEGFNQVGQSLSDLDANTQAGLGTVQGNLMAGQAVLDEGIGQMSDTQDIYYDDLAQRQQAMQQGQDEFRSNFEDYVDRYSNDTTLANQTRADLQTGLATGVNRIRDQIGQTAQQEQLQAAQQQGFMAQQFSNLVSQMDPASIVRSRDMAMQFAQNPQLDPGLRQDLNIVGTSFDNNGNLIMNSVDAAGNAVARNIDNAGMLNVRMFDAGGRPAGERAVNLTNTFDAIQTLQNVSALPSA